MNGQVGVSVGLVLLLHDWSRAAAAAGSVAVVNVL